MNKTLFLFFAFGFFWPAIIVSQCTFSTTAQVHAYFPGGWALSKRCGGLAGQCMTPQQIGFRAELRFGAVTGQSIQCSYFESGMAKFSGPVYFGLSTQSSFVWEVGPITQLDPEPLRLVVCETYSMVLTSAVADGFEYHFVRDQSVGLAGDESSERLELYPSPASDVLSSPLFKEAKAIRVFDAKGVVTSLSTEGLESGHIFVESLPDGLYVLEMETISRMYRCRFLKSEPEK